MRGNMNPKKIVIVGATSEIAKQCARLLLADTPQELLLLGRNENRLKCLADDLMIRNPSVTVKYIATSFIDPQKIASLVDAIYEESAVDLALIAQGTLLDQKSCQEDLSLCHHSLTINGISPILFAEAFAKHMGKINQGILTLIGSVAGDRARRSNYTYGAGKSLLESYAQGLQHRFAGTAVQVLLVKPGPTDTPMTAHFKQAGRRLAMPEKVASLIVEGIRSKKHVIYAPSIWKYIMFIVRCLPNRIFSKLDL